MYFRLSRPLTAVFQGVAEAILVTNFAHIFAKFVAAKAQKRWDTEIRLRIPPYDYVVNLSLYQDFLGSGPISKTRVPPFTMSSWRRVVLSYGRPLSVADWI